jgi:tetratricopeptide (TPR) repeat protein
MNLSRDTLGLREITVLFFLYFAFAFVINQPGFHSAMIYDSSGLIEGKEQIFAKGLGDTLAMVPARPLFMTSLYLNYAMTGMNPYYFRLLNAGILAAAGVALALLLSLIFSLDGRTGPQTKSWPSAVAALLGLVFVVHPLQSLVVLYIWQREAIMACFFYFSALAAYVGVRSGKLSPTVPGFTLVGLLFFVGLLTKENVITFPIALLLVELILFKQSWKGLVQRAVSLCAVTVIPLFLYLLFTWSLHTADSRISEGVVNRLLVYYDVSGVTPVQVILTESRVFFSYLWSILVPFLVPPHLLEAKVVSSSLWDPPGTAAACAGTIVLLALAIRYCRKRPVEAFGIIFSFVAFLPEALLIPQFLFFGYRAILPMAGILLVLGQVLRWLLSGWEQRQSAYRISVVAACLVVVAGFAAQSFREAARWNPFSFWRTAYAQLPALSERIDQRSYWDVIINYGVELTRAGKPQEAVEVLSKDFASIPAMAPVLVAMGVVRQESVSGEEPLQSRYRIPPALLVKLGLALKLSGRVEEAKRIYAITYNDLGMAFQQSGNLRAAMEQYRLALALRPDFPEALYNLGDALRDVQDFAQSAEYLRKAVESKPNYTKAKRSLGYTLLMSRRFAEAESIFRNLLEKDPRNITTLNALALAFAGQGKMDEARTQFRAALEIDPENKEIQRNLGSLPPQAPARKP